VCVCVCVCVSVTLRYCIKTAKRRITHIMPHDRSGTLVYTNKCVVQSICHSRASCLTCAAVCVRGRRISIGSRRYEGAGSRARSTSDVPQARLDGGIIVQISRTGHPTPTHSAAADYGTCTDAGLQSIMSRIDYCNSVLYGTPNYSIKKLQLVHNNAARIVLQEPRRSHAKPLLRKLHWLPVQQRIDYKVALLTFNVHSTSTPLYLRRPIKEREHIHMIRHHVARCLNHRQGQHLRSAVPKTVIDSDSITNFTSRLKTFLFVQAYSLPFIHSY